MPRPTPLTVTALLCLVAPASWAVAGAVLSFAEPAAAADVSVPVEAAPVGWAPPATRACAVEFDGRTFVTDNCPLRCYEETWDGPVLLVHNACSVPTWVSYIYEDDEGQAWRTPCYEIGGGETLAIPEAGSFGASDRRRIVQRYLPGPAYPPTGFVERCRAETEAVDSPVGWVSDRQRTVDRHGNLGPRCCAP